MRSALGVLPRGIGFFLGSLAVSYLIRHPGHGAPILGYVPGIVGQGTTIVILLWGGGPGTPMYLALGCAGLGLGVALPSLVRIVLDDISPAHAGMAAGALTTAIYIGPAVAVSLIQRRVLHRARRRARHRRLPTRLCRGAGLRGGDLRSQSRPDQAPASVSVKREEAHTHSNETLYG